MAGVFSMQSHVLLNDWLIYKYAITKIIYISIQTKDMLNKNWRKLLNLKSVNESKKAISS